MAGTPATDPAGNNNAQDGAAQPAQNPPVNTEPATPSADGWGAFGRTFWMLNSIEMFERLAYFGIRSVVPIYIMQATEPGGLHMTAIHKGVVYMWWAFLQSWLPMFTGGIADRYGYKRVLFFSIMANSIGYLMMAYLHSYEGFFAGIMVLATGTAFFKPALQGSLAQKLTKENASMGWGWFYWVVNVGAVMAPVFATIILGIPHSAQGWQNLFLASAAYTACNLLLLLTFKDVPSGADKTDGVVTVFWRTVENVWPYWFVGGAFCRSRWVPGLAIAIGGLAVLVFDPLSLTGWTQTASGWGLMFFGLWFVLWLRGGKFTWQLRLPAFLLIMSCFWMMMYQLWDLHPNFIEDWIDSSMVAAHMPIEGWKEYGDRGLLRVPQQILLNLNAALIVLLVVPISWLVRKMRTLSAMLIGMSVAIIGILVAGLTDNGWVLLLGVVFFSLGEMLTGPKKNQYLGLIAPPGKKGLYLGYVNIPIGIGVGFGSIIAGFVYDSYGEKATLALKHLGAQPQLVARAAQAVDRSDKLELIPKLLKIERGQALQVASQELGQSSEQTAGILRTAFKSDEGQIVNLALVHLALSEEFKEKTAQGLAKVLGDETNDNYSKQAAQQLNSSAASINQIGVASYVHLLPKANGVGRFEAFEIVRDRTNQERSPENLMDDATIANMLWELYGNDADFLNNLALEYLAQGTDRINRAVANMTFENPVKELPKRIGVGRTNSFSALSSAMGADDTQIEAALAQLGPAGQTPDTRPYAYLAQLPHRRFTAVGRRDWKRDVDLLKEFIESDPNAKIRALALTAKPKKAKSKTSNTATPQKLDYAKLADNQEFVQQVLSQKDWKQSPDQAAKLLQLNPFEARAIVAAEINASPLSATKLLWDTYDPQYKVWLPFAAIGIIAAIALAIYGSMAKRWSDMNA